MMSAADGVLLIGPVAEAPQASPCWTDSCIAELGLRLAELRRVFWGCRRVFWGCRGRQLTVVRRKPNELQIACVEAGLYAKQLTRC